MEPQEGEEIEEVIEEDGSSIEEEVVEEEYEEEEYEEEEVVEEGEEGTSENPIMLEEEVGVTTTDDDGAVTDAENAESGEETQEVASQQADEEQGLVEKGSHQWNLPTKFVAERKPPMSPILYWIPCCLVIALIGGMAGLGYYLTEEENKDTRDPSLAYVPPTNPPTIATVSNFDSIRGNCDEFYTLNTPHPYDQCICTGKIENVPEDIASRYNYLLSAFVGSLYGDGDWTATDISDCAPQNQALVWLSTAENSLYSSEEQAQRYALATLFSGAQGMQWSDKKSWMTNTPTCWWFGVECDGSSVAVVSLENNLLKGPVSRYPLVLSII